MRSVVEELAPPPLPEVTGSRWAALALLGSIVVVLWAVACFGRVEITSKARGSLRVGAGPMPVVVQVSGVVAGLSVKAGDMVVSDQQIARVETGELSARVERTSRQVQLLREEQSKAESATKQLEDRALQALRRTAVLLSERARLKQEQLASRRRQAERMRELVREKVAAETDLERADDATATTREELLLLRQQVAEIGVQIAEREHAFGTERMTREFEVREAEVGLVEAETLAVLGQVRAPEAGRVESLLVAEGQVVQAGSVVAQVIPHGAASSVVVFAPAKDAAFLRSGLLANLEFPSLPVGEFGRARANVTRVGSDLALPPEVSAILGADESAAGGLVRVELGVVEDDVWRKMAPRLHSGAQVIARLETRKRRIITLLVDFLEQE